MSRITFAIAVPLFLAAIAGLSIVAVLGTAFQMEGCRGASQSGGGDWRFVSDTAIFGLVAVAIIGACLAALRSLLRQRLTTRLAGLELAALPMWIGIACLSAWLFQVIGFVVLCNAPGMMTMIVRAASAMIFPLAGAFLLSLVVAYAQGLRE